MTSALITAKGLVQGVGYRHFVSTKARALGLEGYVENLLSGDVEIVVEGEKTKIETLIGSIREGPPASHVSNLLVEWHLPTNSYKNFEMR